MGDSKVDRKLLKGFEQSLAAVVGDDGSRAVVKLGGIPEDKFDPGAIQSSLDKVFGASKEGLSALQTNVLKGMFSTLGVVGTDERSLTVASFVKSLEVIADRYKMKESAALGSAGFAAGIISSICCLGPLAFSFLGFASLSASLTLAMDLTSRFKPVELGASVVLLGVTILFQLRRGGECSLSGLRRNLAYIFIPSSILLVTYAVVNYLLGVSFFGGAGSLLP